MALPSSSADDAENTPRPRCTTRSRKQSSNGYREIIDYVSIPSLSPHTKQKHREAAFTDSDYDPDENQIIEFVGEYRLGTDLFLYARYRDGICRRKYARDFAKEQPELFSLYEEKKIEGTLELFDPSAAYVHYKDRARLSINIKKTSASTKFKGGTYKKDKFRAQAQNSSDSFNEFSQEVSDTDTDSYEEGTRRNPRRTKRLPFSPRKTRSFPRKLSDNQRDTNSYSSNQSNASAAESDEASTRVQTKDKTERRKAKRKIHSYASVLRDDYGVINKVVDVLRSESEGSALTAHRLICAKCHEDPAHLLMKKFRKKTGRKRAAKRDDDASADDEQSITQLGGWVRCLRCCTSAHWGCLAQTQRAEILRAAKEKNPAFRNDGETSLEISETTVFVCGVCSKGDKCYGCGTVVVHPLTALGNSQEAQPASNSRSSDLMTNASEDGSKTVVAHDLADDLLFRCLTCRRLAHYSCLPGEKGVETPLEKAVFYQTEDNWLCRDCAAFKYRPEKIIAWRPFDQASTSSNDKTEVQREYLVKWSGRSFRRLQWVPHLWIICNYRTLVRNFLARGPLISLVDLSSPEKSRPQEIHDNSTATTDPEEGDRQTIAAVPDAEQRINPAWRTVDRVLDVLFCHPDIMIPLTNNEEISDEEGVAELRAAFELGEQPGETITMTIEEYEDQVGREISTMDADRVVWAFLKWEDLSYGEATWDSPPLKDDDTYSAFENAFNAFIQSRKVRIPFMSKQRAAEFDGRGGRKHWDRAVVGIPESNIYDIGQSDNLKLIDFQTVGVNWLCRNWFVGQPSILADEMGLGKTVQLVTFLGLLAQSAHASPCLVVVPNSTITNWQREFTRWATRLRVVAFNGEAQTRQVVREYEMFHKRAPPGCTNTKFHVLLTTYETLTNSKDFSVFKETKRWEVLVVDEGQRLKNDSNSLFSRLNELNSRHRVLMTGTPLNNNIRELFNLMNFLDPGQWNDLEMLEKKYKELTEELVQELHEKLRPYFLRRVKAEVLKLPPKNEVIVPLSMTTLQKEVYKSVLSQDLQLLKTLSRASSSRSTKSSFKNRGLRNILMQLRKCLQHPYLVADDIEPKDLSELAAHEKLIDGSAKLRFLKVMLPKLKFRGHRVLLFSQFKIALDIIEDFLRGENYKYLRLDGEVKQSLRQSDMDEFNREGSDIFIYILSTRAGGVGINLWSADTVIIFDPDFNPHQDLQAISRAHRYGQTKTCLVFKFMVKDSAEERIMQTGKKKLVLDHVIVQRMEDDEEEGNDIQSILTYGAKALFEDTDQVRDINYSDQDIDDLIERTEKEGDQNEPEDQSKALFSFAKIWSTEKNSLEELPDNDGAEGSADSWADVLSKIEQEKSLNEKPEAFGRGVRRKAALLNKTGYYEAEVSPQKADPSKKRKRGSASDSDYCSHADNAESSESESDVNNEQDVRLEMELDLPASDLSVLQVSQVQNDTNLTEPVGLLHASSIPVDLQDSATSRFFMGAESLCGLCASYHSSGSCYMTLSSANLIEYRQILLTHGEDEPLEDRYAAIKSIEEQLKKRGHLHLINASVGDKQQNGGKISGGTKFPNNGIQLPSLDSTHSNSSQDVVRSAQRASKKPSKGKIRLSQTVQTHESNPLPAKKRPKNIAVCKVCYNTPHHLVIDCPVVKGGPNSVVQAIGRVSKEGGNTELIDGLQRKLKQPETHTSAPSSSNNMLN